MACIASLGLVLGLGTLAKQAASLPSTQKIHTTQTAFASLSNYTPFPDLSPYSPQHQLQALARRYVHLNSEEPRALIQAAVRQHALVHHIPLTVALGISGHESGGWQMWHPKTRKPLANVNYGAGGQVVSTDWGVMQINDRAHPEAFPRARQDIAHNIAFGMALLAKTHQVYRGSLNLGFGTWDTTIAAYHLGHAPTASEMPQVQHYIQQLKALLKNEALLPDLLYTVQAGDTLEKIAAQHYGAATDWKRIWHHNQAHISHPEHLRAGLEIRIPLSSLRVQG